MIRNINKNLWCQTELTYFSFSTKRAESVASEEFGNVMIFPYWKYLSSGAYGIGRLPNARVGLVQTLHPADLKRGKADLAPAQNEAFHGEGHLSLTLTVITDYESSCLPSGGPPALSKILDSWLQEQCASFIVCVAEKVWMALLRQGIVHLIVPSSPIKAAPEQFSLKMQS